MYDSAGAGEQGVAEFEYIGVGVGDAVGVTDAIAGVNFYRCLHNGKTCNLIFADEAWNQYDMNRHLLSWTGRTRVTTMGSVQISSVLSTHCQYLGHTTCEEESTRASRRVVERA